MPANLTVHSPVIPVETVSGNTPQTNAYQEAASQTFKAGVPVQLATGAVQVWNGTTYTAGIFGVSNEMAHNLPSTGAGMPGPFAQIGPPGAIQTWGSVPNEVNALNISIGTPIADGRCLVLLANADTIFEAQFDNSATGTPNYTTAYTMVQQFFGLTFDSTGYAYIDGNKTTVGTNTNVQVVRLNPVDGPSVNGRLQFIFAVAARQLNG